MPVKSLNSSVIKWPDQKQIYKAVRSWALIEIKKYPEILRIGYFGSYARGDWGVGSDLDLVAIVKESNKKFECRAMNWDLHVLPVQAELLVYTTKEWQNMKANRNRFVQVIEQEAIWIYGENYSI
ncbi:MAG: nucleotidyltransferase domain-containing protein [Candidatus Marinimicrobia bacterium]|nr:nucleotidyltransferase domain-containing protein [Candidatus Neomarinimicrobiota bacterium]